LARVGSKHLLAILDTRRPVTRLAPPMSNRNHANDISVATEDEYVWEAAQWNSSMNRIELLAEGRQFDEHTGNALDFQNELAAESASFRFIFFCGRNQLLFGLLERTRSSLFETRANTLKHFLSRDRIH
jgi:hypothetical protein